MKHLRLFETEAAFEAAKANLPEPWVVLTEDNEGIHYEKGGEPQPSRFDIITYNATSKLEETTSSKKNGFHINAFNVVMQSHEFADGKGIITFDGAVINIGDNAFDGCSGLTSINIPDSVTSIGFSTFNQCESLTSINIPDSVTSFGPNAFGYCTSLISITIPDSVTSIGSAAFKDCSSLTSITYSGTIAQWNAISKIEGWHSNVPATSVTCTDGATSLD